MRRTKSIEELTPEEAQQLFERATVEMNKPENQKKIKNAIKRALKKSETAIHALPKMSPVTKELLKRQIDF